MLLEAAERIEILISWQSDKKKNNINKKYLDYIELIWNDWNDIR